MVVNAAVQGFLSSDVRFPSPSAQLIKEDSSVTSSPFVSQCNFQTHGAPMELLQVILHIRFFGKFPFPNVRRKA